MNNKSLLKGAVIATAMAGLLSGGVATLAHAGEAAKTVKCSGANSCKGSGSCKSASNECKGKNGCKGQGWINAKDEAECKAKGGKVVQ